MRVTRICLLLVVFNALWLAACGSSSSGGSSLITSVTASCSPASILYGQTSQCSATVTGTGSFSSGVTWAASAGTISNSGLFSAPSGGVTSLEVTITATSTQDTSKSGSATVTVNPAQQANNVQPIVVDAGPVPQTSPDVDEVFTSVTICVHGTTTCQTIDHIQVDTGSAGLRLISSVLTIALPPESDSSGNPLDECTVFSDGYIWGPVVTADITLAGEQASNAPIQVIIPSSSLPAVPSSCSQSSMGPNGNEGGSNNSNSVSTFGANGLIGVGLLQQDCGIACTTQNQLLPDVYYNCPSSGCSPTYVTLPQQVPNPITKFSSDNNGVLIQLPAVPNGGSVSVSGSMIFGIGTQSNNGLGSATVYEVPGSLDNNAGNFTTVFNGTSYPASFIDSGSNGLFFLNSSVPGVPATCSDQNSWYCPTTSPDNLSAGNQGINMSSPVSVSFSIENADMLFSGTNTAFSTLGGHECPSGASSCAFDWGLSFFFGRNVFTAIENMSAPGGTPPYFAY
jgi:Protein of unknown function (DUF3443)